MSSTKGRTDAGNPGDDAFTYHRTLLFTIAYEMLGSAADAEDVVQESWLRWSDVDHGDVRDARAYLIRIVTRQALNRLRTQARRREDYVGEWLPEPLVTSADVAADVELAESVSIAMLTVLETLLPTERAVFVLREVFDVPYEEIGAALGKSASAVRQIAHRARSHVAARRPRMTVTSAEHQEVADRFLTAVRLGDFKGLLDALAPDVVLIADGGGIVSALRRPMNGATRVAKGLIRRLQDVELEAAVMSLNGAPAILLRHGDHEAVMSLAVAEGQVTAIYVMANPHKLTRRSGPTTLGRA